VLLLHYLGWKHVKVVGSDLKIDDVRHVTCRS